MLEKIESALDWGGTKRDIAFLVISAIALIASLIWGDKLPVDPAWIAIVLCGIPIVCEAVIGLVTRFDIKADVLVAMALIASIVIGEYFAAGEVALIMQLGGLLEELTVARAQRGIERLVEITPRSARIVSPDGSEVEIAAENVEVGQHIRILPGETIPADGCIISGNTSIDEAAITGEPMPVDKQPGDEVSSGTVNQFGTIDVRATRAGEDSSIQRMARLVKSADANKAKIVRLADRWATWVVVGALLAAVGVFLVTGEIIRSVTVLVVFCPCSLVLATPTAIMAAIGNATKHGFLVKEGDALERLARVKRVIFDKTGTLTCGKPRVSAVEALPSSGLSHQRLYALLASAELRSEHPLGRAIVECAREEHIEVMEPETFEMIPGLGVKACIDGKLLVVGNVSMMETAGLKASDWAQLDCEAHLNRGDTLTYIAYDGHPAGIVALSDTLRSESEATIAQIRQQGITPVLLTGDNKLAASNIARTVGIETYLSECKPETKMAYIEEAEKAGDPVAMVGDGINDAPALRRSCVGIALGGVGSDIAVDAADVVMVSDDIGGLSHLIALSKHMMRVIKANLTFSMTLNFLAVILAMIAVLDPVTGALVHNCGSVFVIVNSSFLLTWAAKRKG